MKKILFVFILALTMNCETVYYSVIDGSIIRCENDEVICYKPASFKSGIFCKFKED